MPVPTRNTAEQQLDQWNDQLRASPIWQSWMQSRGKIQGGRMIGLSEGERKQFERYLAQNGIRIPSGMVIDQGGNLNQKNRLWRNVGIGAAIGGGALTGFGLAGMGPLAGLGGGAGAAGAAGGVLPSSSFPAASLMGGPAAISSMGASAGIPWAGATGASAALTGGRAAAGAAGAGAADRVGAARNAANGARQLSPWLQAAIAGLSGLPALVANHGPSDEEKALLDEARQMQAMQRQRIERQNPLFDAVTRLAMSRLPGSAQG